MFDRFTDRARRVMGIARQEATRFGHDYIGTEHILLGLLEEGSGVAASVLKNLCSRDNIRIAVTKLVTRGVGHTAMGQLPFTPRAKKVLELSLLEASDLGHTYIGTEHLLLGLIRENEGIAAQALEVNGVLLEDVRDEVMELLGAATSVGVEKPSARTPLKGFDPQEIEVIRKRGGGSVEETRWIATYDAMRHALDVKEGAHKQAVGRQFAAENVIDGLLSALDRLQSHRRWGRP